MQWQYKTHNVVTWTEAALNELGKEGWELVCNNGTLLIFKKPTSIQVSNNVQLNIDTDKFIEQLMLELKKEISGAASSIRSAIVTWS